MFLSIPSADESNRSSKNKTKAKDSVIAAVVADYVYAHEYSRCRYNNYDV